ncbi:GNAT family N-acetyltransferase [Arsenicitalea aurantiaca]|nr:GNAT family N-acetyltransferase [Arsenicitalea aurantiaca]
MLPQIVIRKAVASEAETLADIGYVAWERDLMPFLRVGDRARRAEQDRLSAAVRDSLDRIIVAEAEGVSVGWCSRARGRAYIPYLFVTPLLQNHGIGTALLRRMESILELEGADAVQLDTLADNVRAVKFYEHQGYHILALGQQGRAGQDTTMNVRLEKRLHPYSGPVPDIE